MARSSPKWVWAVLFRDQAPRIESASKSLIAAMYSLNSFTDKTGSTFVGQATLARAACMTPKTLRGALEIAWRAQWVGVTHARFEGKQWRHYEYRLCIPDHLDLTGLTATNETGAEISFEDLVEMHCETYGYVDTSTHPDRSKVGKPLPEASTQIGGQKERRWGNFTR